MHPNAALLTDLAFDLTQALLSPDRAVRDEAERTLFGRVRPFHCRPSPAEAKSTEHEPGADGDSGESALVMAIAAFSSGPAGPSAANAPPEVLARLALVAGAMRLRAALLPLLAALDHASPDAKAAIARSLAEIVDGRDAFDDRVLEALESLATSEDSTARAYAAQGFGAIGGDRARARVRALSDDVDAFVRGHASRTLEKLRLADASLRPASGESFEHENEKETVDEVNDLAPWLRDLGDRRAHVQAAAIEHIVSIGQRAVPELLLRLHGPYARPRIAAARALGRLRTPKAAGPLLIAAAAPITTPEEALLRPVALRALVGCLTGEETGLAAALLPLAKKGDRHTRAAALLCLGRVADRQGIRHVVDALTDDDALIMESATIALSEGIREDDTALVVPLLNAYDMRARKGLTALKEAILIALSRIHLDHPGLRVRVRHRVRRETQGATAAVRRLAIALCNKLYDESDPPVLPLIDAVLLRLDDTHGDVRVVAADFLATHLPAGFPGALPILRTCLKRQQPSLSGSLLRAIARLDTAGARELLHFATRLDDHASALLAAELVEKTPGTTATWQPVQKSIPQKASFRPSISQTARLATGQARVERTPATKDNAAPAAGVVPKEKPLSAASDQPEKSAAASAPGTAKEEAAGDAKGGEAETGDRDVVDATFNDVKDPDSKDPSTDEGSPLEPAMSLPDGEMPAPGDDDGSELPPPD